ncbi:methyl-accepting chemotaxis protein, partial [Paraburkholderia xenovorans]|uniref:HAMP domain-containing protein n=1 Tax=Paraburkholderia xenovorans TaxID=36873 RepID=UPI0038BE0F40
MIRSIRTLISLTCVSIVVVALAVAGGISYMVVQSYSKETINQNLESVANGRLAGIEDWVASRSRMIASLQEAALTPDPVPAFKQIENAGGFTKVYAGYPDKSAKRSDSSEYIPNYDPTSRPWYKQAVAAGRPVLTQPYVSASNHKLVVTVAVPILHNGHLESVVAGDIGMDSVIANVKAIRPTPASFGFLVDSGGTVIAHADDRLILAPATELSPELTAATLDSMTRSSAPVEVKIGGAVKLLYRRSVANTDWSLIVALDKADATAGLRSLLKVSAIVLVAVALLSAIIVGMLTSYVFRRLSMVRDAMDAIGSADGDLTKRLPSDGADEVAQIARSFNTFADKLTVVLEQIQLGSDSVRT